jgi:hypothetical protein
VQLSLQFCCFGRKWPNNSPLSSKVAAWKERVGRPLILKEEKIAHITGRDHRKKQAVKEIP